MNLSSTYSIRKLTCSLLLLVIFVLSSPFATAQTPSSCSKAATSGYAAEEYDNFVNSEQIIRNQKGEGGFEVSTTNQATPPTETSATNQSAGTIVTCGDVFDGEDANDGYDFRRAHALEVYSDKDGIITVVNEGKIETQGTAARGINVSLEGEGDASVTNHGSVVTFGNGAQRSDNDRLYGAYGINIWVGSATGTAKIVNERDGTVITKGTGARGLQASTAGSGDVTVINRGSVTTEGGLLITEGVRFMDSRASRAIAALADGSGKATVTNEGEGIVKTQGARARGLYARSYFGAAEGTNSGTITTEGESADGMYIAAYESKAAVTNEGEGIVKTQGAYARGLYAWSLTGAAEGTNSGTITTEGESADGMVAFIYGLNSQISESAKVTNKGKVITKGARGTAVGADTYTGGNEENPNKVHAVNAKEGSIETSGAQAYGLTANVSDAYSGDSYGRAIAENHGTITMTGDPDDNNTGGTVGVGAWHNHDLTAGGTAGGKSGDSIVINSGDVVASGQRAVGLEASTDDNGTATVKMTGGSVIAGTEGSKYGTGIYASVQTSAASADTPDSSGDNDIDITVSGASTAVTGHSAATDDETTSDIDESKGFGIRAVINPAALDPGVTDGTGHIRVRITQGATITAARALNFSGGRATVNVNDSVVNGAVDFDGGAYANVMKMQSGTIAGNINFGQGDDSLEIDGGSSIKGRIDFMGGADQFTLLVNKSDGSAVRNVNGDISNVRTMIKQGTGAAYLGPIKFQDHAESSFSCSSGTCIISRHIDLGSSGTMSIGEDAALMFEIGDIGTEGHEDDHGRITAKEVKFNSVSTPTVEMVLDSELSDEKIKSTNSLVQKDTTVLNVFEGATSVKDSNDAAITSLKVTSAGAAVGAIENGQAKITANLATGQRPIDPTTPPTTPTVSSGGDSSGSGGVFAAALIGILAVMALDDDDDSSQLTDYVLQNASTPKLAIQKAVLLQPGQTRTWARFNSHRGITPVQGVVVGMDTELGKGLQGSIAVMPNASSSWNKSAHSQSLTDHVSFTGTSYMLRGRWQGDTMFTNASYMHGDFRANSRFINTTTIRGSFSGQSDVVQNHLQLEAGAKLNVKDNAVLKPSLSVYGGSVRQGAHTAHSSLLSAEVPAYTQKYRAWKFGIKAKFAKWIESSSGVRWQPQAEFSTHRIHSDEPTALTLKQTDASGILGFTNQIPIKKMPGKVNMFKTGVKIRKSDNVQLRLDYAGMQFDGEVHHGALASIKWKF